MLKTLRYILVIFLAVGYNTKLFAVGISNEDKNEILLLSGSNNHDWQKTTPLLARILTESDHFNVIITNQPDTLVYNDLTKFDVIVSNWNSWPDNDLLWPEKAQDGLLRYLKEGGGLVFFHSSTSVFYLWPEFKMISTGAWVENTWHEAPGIIKMEIVNQDHYITKGIADFYIFDELWIDAEQNEEFEILGYAFNTESSGRGLEKQPAIFVSEYGNGRIFHTILGHDIRAMSNTGFKTLILRGTEWAAKSEVTIVVPEELNISNTSKTTGLFLIKNDY